ncbi:hypothetical protein PCCS19_26280 [Paenibacillus sp. CCS19]|uniref:hypothetical protein n=1 Tax=Paenibacillus sp. CCS19 TaxID=3158387 RepID=UPI0025614A1B|nr:hypothetical protein [Paenibacillus cellulosilyticus]GMK39574.1 hypothetical protein PCCS19_26280 [Paenibacillus cellulosilyticus]
MDEQLTRAKELFTSYDGSTFHMYRAGHLEEYKQYEIPKQLELDWFNEMIAQYSRELSITDWKAVTRLSAIAANCQNERILKNVLSFASRNVLSSDSIVKLMYAEGILEIIHKIKSVLPDDRKLEAYKTTHMLLEDIINKPLIIDPGHELEQFNLRDKKSLNERAKRSMEKIVADLG